jgi:hypothetical protein
MRARKVVTRSGKRIRGKFPSTKLGRMVHWESLYERDAILYLFSPPATMRRRTQPEQWRWPLFNQWAQAVALQPAPNSAVSFCRSRR